MSKHKSRKPLMSMEMALQQLQDKWPWLSKNGLTYETSEIRRGSKSVLHVRFRRRGRNVMHWWPSSGGCCVSDPIRKADMIGEVDTTDKAVSLAVARYGVTG